MTPVEKKLASKLLDMASEKFSNHGCNDFDLVTEGGLTAEEADVFQRAFYEWNGSPGDYEPGNTNLADFAAMSFLSDLLEKDT